MNHTGEVTSESIASLRRYKVPRTQQRSGENPLSRRIRLLRDVAASLSQAVDELEDFQTSPLTDQFDFYDEVRRFEISLIRKALKTTRGCQLAAARLLRLKPTTLNSKIKTYQIYTPER
jgi:transcriptional regulator with GAF, ATPase, and Fis domain